MNNHGAKLCWLFIPQYSKQKRIQKQKYNYVSFRAIKRFMTYGILNDLIHIPTTRFCLDA